MDMYHVRGIPERVRRGDRKARVRFKAEFDVRGSPRRTIPDRGFFFVSSLFLFSFPFSVSSLFFSQNPRVQCSEGAATRVSARPRRIRGFKT